MIYISSVGAVQLSKVSAPIDRFIVELSLRVPWRRMGCRCSRDFVMHFTSARDVIGLTLKGPGSVTQVVAQAIKTAIFLIGVNVSLFRTSVAAI